MDSDIVDGWKRGTIADLVRLNARNWDPRQGGTIRYMDIASIERTGALGQLRELDAEGAPSRARRRVVVGDTVVSTVRPYLRAFAQLRDAPENLVASTGFAVLTPALPSDAEFVYQQVLRDEFVSFLEPRMTGTGYPAVHGEDVIAFPIQVPPPQQREGIGQILRAIDEAIEKTEAVIAATGELRKALLQELLTRGVPGWHTEWKTVPGIGTIPACWEVVRLGEVLLDIQAGRSPNCESRPAGPEEWGVLKVSSVSWDEFLPDENKALPPNLVPDPQLEVHQGDVLVSRANTPDLVGRSVYVDSTRAGLLLCDKTLRLIPKPGHTDGSFINGLLSMYYVRRQIEDSATGTSMSMQNISQNAIRGLKVASPPLSEQVQMMPTLNQFRIAVGSERSLLAELKTLKSAAADGLLTGRVRVPVRTEATK